MPLTMIAPDGLTVERLIEIGGKRWTKGEKDRIYFNDLPSWYGLKTTLYNTGNISSATLDGTTISNRQAKLIAYELGLARVWYDVQSGRFCGSGFKVDRDFDHIVDAIINATRKDS